jgi:hypothetical protein
VERNILQHRWKHLSKVCEWGIDRAITPL